MKMEYAASLPEALERAYELKGKDASVTYIPDGISVIVRPVAKKE